ncbi:hypothetical protein [Polycladomyces subterraneus]|uniref:Uncharacterized protein n=1 Tax=Polycladomyces subterraneus TaxID=1016997 RepID=A0ABT8IPK4_9BACL|nr:hypothetical protein [Polycladomyces subterraneus]MDN4594720.1 hypothetical protein [Polycladomyces subterraneus]
MPEHRFYPSAGEGWLCPGGGGPEESEDQGPLERPSDVSLLDEEYFAAAEKLIFENRVPYPVLLYALLRCHSRRGVFLFSVRSHRLSGVSRVKQKSADGSAGHAG